GFKSTNAAEDHLRSLARKGAITLTAGASRSIRLVEEAESAAAGSTTGSTSINFCLTLADSLRKLLMPVVAKVAAARRLLAAEQNHRELSVDPSLFEQQSDYLLTVK